MINFDKEFFNAGKYKNLDINNIDKNELLKGVKVEMEHTTNLKIATKIALDHLAEDKHYYTKLLKAGL
jgi:hypothetical protein